MRNPPDSKPYSPIKISPPAHDHDHDDNDSQSHSHSDKHKHQNQETIKAKLDKLADKIKSVDGIDETAHVLGQILPGIAGPIATASVLTLANPAVLLGVFGMKHEYEDAIKQYQEILKSDKDTRIKIKTLAEAAFKSSQKLSDKLGLQVDLQNVDIDKEMLNSLNKDSVSNQIILEQLFYNIYQNQLINNRKIVLAISKKYGWTGVMAMSGMFAGMVASTTSAGFEIGHAASEGAIASSLNNAATISGIVAGGLFLPAQVAMGVYAGSRAYQGNQTHKQLEKQLNTIKNNAAKFLNPVTMNHVDQALQKQKKYIFRHSKLYGGITIPGQICMASGTIAALLGAGLAVLLPLFLLGAPLTIFAAIDRIINQEKEKKFHGKNNNYVKSIIETINPLTLIMKAMDDKNNKAEDDKYKKPFEILEKKLQISSNSLAWIKLLSLIHHLNNDRKYRDLNQDKKLQILQTKINPNGKYKIKDSGLEKNVVDLVRSMLAQNKEFISNLLKLDNKSANLYTSKMIAKILSDLKADKAFDPKEPFIAMENKENNNDLLISDKDIEIYESLGLHHHSSPETGDYKDFSRKLLNTSKASAKHIRLSCIESIIGVANCMDISKKLARDNAQDKDDIIASKQENPSPDDKDNKHFQNYLEKEKLEDKKTGHSI